MFPCSGNINNKIILYLVLHTYNHFLWLDERLLVYQSLYSEYEKQEDENKISYAEFQTYLDNTHPNYNFFQKIYFRMKEIANQYEQDNQDEGKEIQDINSSEFDTLTYDPIKKYYIQVMKEFKEMQQIFYQFEKNLFSSKVKRKKSVSQTQDNLIIAKIQSISRKIPKKKKKSNQSSVYSSIMDFMINLLKKMQIQDFQFQFPSIAETLKSSSLSFPKITIHQARYLNLYVKPQIFQIFGKSRESYIFQEQYFKNLRNSLSQKIHRLELNKLSDIRIEVNDVLNKKTIIFINKSQK